MAVVTASTPYSLLLFCTYNRCARDVSVSSSIVSLPGCCCSTLSLCVLFFFCLSSPSLPPSLSYTLSSLSSFAKPQILSLHSYQLWYFINSLLIALDISCFPGSSFPLFLSSGLFPPFLLDSLTIPLPPCQPHIPIPPFLASLGSMTTVPLPLSRG